MLVRLQVTFTAAQGYYLTDNIYCITGSTNVCDNKMVKRCNEIEIRMDTYYVTFPQIV